MPAILSTHDQKAFVRHREAGVLRHVRPELVRGHIGTNPFTAIHCSDPHRTRDCLNHLFRTVGSDFVAPIALPGIPVCISNKSPVPAARCIRESTFFGVDIACKLGIKTLLFVTHAPCLVAYEHGIGFDFLLELLIDSKEALVRRFGLRVVMMVHVAFPQKENIIPALSEEGKAERQLTYFVSKKHGSTLFG